MKKFRTSAIVALLIASACVSSSDNSAVAARLSNGPATNSSCDAERDYCPSPLQVRVDRSFSAIAIGTQQTAVGQELAEVRINGCENYDGCDWRDENGVRHYFWGDSDTDLWVVIKIVRVEEFVGHPISVLGIGMARQQEDVLPNVRRFLGDVPLECSSSEVSGNVGRVKCDATLDPGWIRIGFSEPGELLEIRFDGYHFT